MPVQQALLTIEQSPQSRNEKFIDNIYNRIKNHHSLGKDFVKYAGILCLEL